MNRAERRAASTFSVWPIVGQHYAAMRDARTNRIAARTKVWLVAFPMLLGGLTLTAVVAGMDLRDGVSQVLAGTALLVGAMLSLFVFITNLRVKVAESPTYAFRTRLHQLLGGTAAGCMYVALFSLVVAAELAAIASLQVLRHPDAQPIVAAVLVASMTHLGATLLSVVRRLFGTYYELFAADFDPSLDVVSEQPEGQRDDHRGSGKLSAVKPPRGS